MNRGKPGLHRESIKMFNTSGINRESPGRTGNDRRCTGNNWDGTVAPPGPIQTPAELRQRPGECRSSPGVATVYKKLGALPKRHRHSTELRRGITGDDRGKTGALP
ncbi:hypothetical protein DPMN_107822 [Dreissena polymorpha]|uniref:Uncharacterized protein n=1 Tax=Dreissena polymorpha TaxID=45954 RepID=A0A9D4QKJ2_DREPO|nr:hypothetical protein DPMN_107822 [Dreissena polymorpha]